jgi:uncharacterized protein YdhG (YjbR/CyaY superfamily)
MENHLRGYIRAIKLLNVMATPKATTVDEYIDGFPEDTRKVLKRIRNVVKKVIPKAEETISYGIPTFKLNDSYVVYFAGFKKHVSVYPTPSGSAAFEKQLAPYRSGKGTAQFELGKPLPEKLIIEIVKQNLKKNKERAKT